MKNILKRNILRILVFSIVILFVFFLIYVVYGENFGIHSDASLLYSLTIFNVSIVVLSFTLSKTFFWTNFLIFIFYNVALNYGYYYKGSGGSLLVWWFYALLLNGIQFLITLVYLIVKLKK